MAKVANVVPSRGDTPGETPDVAFAAIRLLFLRENPGAPAMQSNSRTFVSVVGTVMMVVTTVLLASWSPPQSETPIHPAANQASIVLDH
ncbi:hypothetical protein AB0I53_14905 [Saccharopolyspora sp. NPDC050389]|uniref:hypothetical protein n=1 Tax=Saccharopolyspora sp. NPDC050389 TaxID=3155516 RepID=UPI0033E5F52F